MVLSDRERETAANALPEEGGLFTCGGLLF